MINITGNSFYSNQTWDKHIINVNNDTFGKDSVDLFDQNGYRLTRLEQDYSVTNQQTISRHGNEQTLRKLWMEHEPVVSGPHLNHAYLFERKGYSGEALHQLHIHSRSNNLLNKLIQYRGKWGVDFSLDYVDNEGNALELLHFEFDGCNLNEILYIKGVVEETILKVDWEFAAKTLISKKDEWINLGFFEQSKYKTDFFNLPEERFKMIAWY